MALFTHPSSDESILTSKTQTKQNHELVGIEVLRFICAFAILIWHYQHFFFTGEYDKLQAEALFSAMPFYKFLEFAYDHGDLAVQFFWVISGFIFYWRYADPIYEGRVSIIEFATRRFSRLYPLHFTTLVLIACLQYFYISSHGNYFIYLNNSVPAFILQLFFASNWFYWQTETYSFNGPIWSISVEILIYFSFFLIARTLGARMLVAIAISGLSWLLLRSTYSNIFLSSNVFACAVLFFAGGATQRMSKHRFAITVAVCASALTLVLFALGIIQLRYGMVVVLALSSVLLFARFGEIKAGIVFKHVAFLGNATYSSYLMHFPIQLGTVLIVDALGYDRSLFLNPIAFITYLAAMTGISLAVYHWFELPAQNWIRSSARRFNRPSLQGK